MFSVRPRRWDVGRYGALVTGVALLAAACGSPHVAAPPDPEFTTGQRAEPMATPSTLPATVGVVELSSIEPDIADVGRMVIVDDAGNAAPNFSGWTVFETGLERRLVPANVSASVAVMIDGQLVHQAAFGERVAGGGDRVDIADRFRVASISKTISAIVALQLVESGELALDGPIGDLIIDHLGVAVFDPDIPSTTLRELLSHTSGFPAHDAMFFSTGATSCVDAAAQGIARSVASGSGFRYSNMNFCVLGVLIEAVTGKTYERVVYERLLTPLGVSGMRMASTYDLGPDEVSHHPTPNRNYMETLGAAGSWNATPTDLVTILNSVDPKTPGWKALSVEMMESMRSGSPTGYGLGLIDYFGGAYGHTGTIQNAHSMVLVQPDGVTWAVTVSGSVPSDTPQLRDIVQRVLVAAFPAA
jgi:D-alanyl-D-alanine carboxypeptidase